jgi:glyoxylase-like metal-dependent hydrolase (beta-lactamase superfamily II)
MRDIFGLDDRTVETAMREAGVEPEAIDDVIVSHLHFDHAGGLTRACRDGEEPDWVASEGVAPLATDRVKVTFANATIHVQEREWRDATANSSVMTRTYYRDHLDPIAAQVRLVDSARPFPPGLIPQRDELPRTPVEHRMSEVLPGVHVFLTPGHTWGQQAAHFVDVSGQGVVFTPDVMPSVHHLGAAYSLAYDVEAYTSMVTKRWFLDAAAERDWLLVLDHEPGNPLQRVRRSDRGWFDLVPEAAKGT